MAVEPYMRKLEQSWTGWGNGGSKYYIYLEGLDKRLLVIKVGSYHFHSLGRECLCSVTIYVTSNTPDLPCSFFESGTND